MILLKKSFWALVRRLAITLTIELAFCLAFLVVLFVIYMTTEIEALNTNPFIIYYKGFLSLPPCIYNAKQLLIATKERDYFRAVGFIGITALYCLFVWTLGGGGR